MRRGLHDAGRPAGIADNLHPPRVPEREAMPRQTGSSRTCSAMRNFSFLFGDNEGKGLIRNL